MRKYMVVACLAFLGIAGAGCPYSFQTALAPHIRTVQIQDLKNLTYYKNIDSKLNSELVKKLNAEPRISVVNANGDAILSGEIVDVQKTVLSETKSDRPDNMRLTITVRFSFYDRIEQKHIVKDLEINSQRSSSGAGLYRRSDSGARESAEDVAIKELASEIVRRIICRF